MIGLVKQWLNGEKGQALAIVLALLAIGGLTIAVSLNYATTNLKGSRIVEEKMAGVYAAGAGVEQALWSLGSNSTPPTQLPQSINQMAVGIETLDKGTFTLYLGELIDASGVHVEWLDVDGTITSTNVTGRYQYTATVIWQPGSGLPVIKLEEVGARIPVGYSYLTGSAADFAGNLSTGEPAKTLDEQGAWLLNWVLGSPRPSVSENQTTRTQSFYITGSGSQGGEYAWLVAQPDAIGVVGEITGTRYKITATARRPESGRTTAEIVANVIIKDDGTINILSWQITK